VNKPRTAKRRPFGFDILARKGSQRLAARLDQRFGTLADEVMRDVMLAVVATLTDRRARRSLAPVRRRPR
jgi:hypothetical protein